MPSGRRRLPVRHYFWICASQSWRDRGGGHSGPVPLLFLVDGQGQLTLVACLPQSYLRPSPPSPTSRTVLCIVALLQTFLAASGTSVAAITAMYYFDSTKDAIQRFGDLAVRSCRPHHSHHVTHLLCECVRAMVQYCIEVGLPMTGLGGFLLGVGMAVSGSCPGTVRIRLSAALGLSARSPLVRVRSHCPPRCGPNSAPVRTRPSSRWRVGCAAPSRTASSTTNTCSRSRSMVCPARCLPSPLSSPVFLLGPRVCGRPVCPSACGRTRVSS